MRDAAPSALSAGLARSAGLMAGQHPEISPPETAEMGVRAPPRNCTSGMAQIF
jgi:hypothetical protein